MIWMQRKDASHVAGFQTWKEMGRWVKKGEKGIAILAPMVFNKKDAAGQKTDEKFIGGFRVVHVFDIAQTEGKPLPEAPSCERLTGAEDAGIFTALLDFAMRGGLTVLPAFDSFDDERNGDYSPTQKQIRIRSGLSILQRAKTMAHECAHWILHTSTEGAQLAREVKETEAEAVAYLALARFGFPSDAYSFGYIAAWARGDSKIMEASLSRIQKAADEVVHAIESRISELDPVEA
jgi:antirestriction protein ArdC